MDELGDGAVAAPPDVYADLLAEAEQTLDRVTDALARLDAGTYGTCQVCDEPIPDADLEATPTARQCHSHLPVSYPS